MIYFFSGKKIVLINVSGMIILYIKCLHYRNNALISKFYLDYRPAFLLSATQLKVSN